MSSASAKTNPILSGVDDEARLASLPSGFKFNPTDAILINYYLAKKVLGEKLPPNLMKEVLDFYSYHPRELTQKYKGYEPKNPTDWYFFTGKYHGEENAETYAHYNAVRGSLAQCTAGGNAAAATNSVRVRVAGEGFWLSTTHSSSIYSTRDSSTLIGYKGSWAYYEVRDSKESASDYDEWILCRIYENKNRGDDDAHVL
ncbi:hypothetical protein MKX01_026387 [Papaver californicum]|nr:hypothetical protein MKX01_004283 [Papaver californicum]KAI3996214.1 hypothetical protein MKX01_026387 [Papaver californicum]